MGLADEMRRISENADKGVVEDAYNVIIRRIKEASEEGLREIVWSPAVSNPEKFGMKYVWEISSRDRELLKEKLEQEGFRIVQPGRYSGGVRQVTKYIQW